LVHGRGCCTRAAFTAEGVASAQRVQTGTVLLNELVVVLGIAWTTMIPRTVTDCPGMAACVTNSR
jgi:hypothetical protein